MEFITDIVDNNGAILRPRFSFNGHDYQITGTSSTGFSQKAINCRDTLSRDDGRIIEITRLVLRDYFAGRIKDKNIIDNDIKIIQEGTK